LKGGMLLAILELVPQVLRSPDEMI
jgi:hypothetical protein